MTKQQLFTSVIGIFAFALVVSACQPKVEPSTPVDDTVIEENSESMIAEPADGEMVDETTNMDKGKTITDTQTYQSPAGPEEVGFSIVVDDTGTISEVSVENKAKAPISITRQDAFKAEIEAAVVGKKLSELEKIDRVGGSSLTTGAFNAFLTEAKEQV